MPPTTHPYSTMSVSRSSIDRYILPGEPLSQAGYTLALSFGLVPDSLREEFASHLAEDVRTTGHLTTGFLGTPLICSVLTEFGYEEEAWHLLSRTEYPSWLYSVSKGATTMWERWDAIQPDGEVGAYSLNHYAYGAVLEWMFRDVAGIGQAEGSTGFEDIVIRPQLTHSLKWVRASYDSPAGMIAVEWHRTEDAFHIAVDAPAPATIILPEPDRQGRKTIRIKAGHFENW